MVAIDYKLVGEKIKTCRKQMGLTQEQLAELCDVSPSYLGHIERASRKLTLDTAANIADCLNVSIDYLLLSGLESNVKMFVNIESMLKRCAKPKVDTFVNTVKVLAENIDKL